MQILYCLSRGVHLLFYKWLYTCIYWVGQKVCSGFYIRSNKKPKWNFWPTYIFMFACCNFFYFSLFGWRVQIHIFKKHAQDLGCLFYLSKRWTFMHLGFSTLLCHLLSQVHFPSLYPFPLISSEVNRLCFVSVCPCILAEVTCLHFVTLPFHTHVLWLQLLADTASSILSCNVSITFCVLTLKGTYSNQVSGINGIRP